MSFAAGLGHALELRQRDVVSELKRGDSLEDRCQRAEFDRTVIGHGNVMGAHPFTRQTNVRTVLPLSARSQAPEVP